MASDVFSVIKPLNCDCCGRDLKTDHDGIFVTWNDRDKNEVVEAYVCCKGDCDQKMKAAFHQQNGYEHTDGWYDLKDISNPYGWLKWLLAWMNGFQNGEKISNEAYSKLKDVALSYYPEIARNYTPEEKELVMRYHEQGFQEFL